MDNQQDVFEKLAYTVGFFLGDGTLYCATTRGSYQVRFEKPDVECLEKVSLQMGVVFGNPGSIHFRRRESWRTGKLGVETGTLIVCSRAAHDWLASATAMRTCVPPIYFDAPDAVRLELLAGLMDSDGSAEVTAAGYLTVRFTNNNLALIQAVRGLAESFGISYGDVIPDYRHKNVGYRMTLNSREFARRAYFCSARKEARLQAYRDKEFLK